MPSRRYRPLLFCFLLLGGSVSGAGAMPPGPRGAEDVIDSPMYRDPDPPAARVMTVFPDGLTALWLRALQGPDAELRGRAADAIALAHRQGMKRLGEVVPALLAEVDRADQHPVVRLSVARALVALDAREAAPVLLRQTRSGGSDLRGIVEPALASWDYKPAREKWLERLDEAAPTTRDLVLAVRLLGEVREARAGDRLRRMAVSRQVSVPIRLEAARALGSVRTEGLERDAERLAADPTPRGVVSRLAAAAMLQNHRGDAAVRILKHLTGDPEPAVAALAVAPLIRRDASPAVAQVEKLLTSPDSGLRAAGVEVLFLRPTTGHVCRLGERLDDPDPEVRARARAALRGLAGRTEFREAVLQTAEGVLATRQWQGLEQAAILLTELKDKKAAFRMVELLTFDRPEVFVTAAWGLRKLAVPETLPSVVAYVEAERGRSLAGKPLPGREQVSLAWIDHQLSQLNQLLGGQKYRPAETVLREYIPRRKDNAACESRAAAVWSLGLLHEGEPDAALAAALEARLNDTPPSGPWEDSRVRRMAAVALGRMKAKTATASLRKNFETGKPSSDPVNNACGWALGQFGEVIPPPGMIEKVRQDLFLTPYR